MSRTERFWVCLAITAGLLEGVIRLAHDATSRLLETSFYR